MAIADELQKLEELHRTGVLSDDEFAKAKASVIASTGQAPPSGTQVAAPRADLEGQTRTWAMVLHLSLLAGCLVPFAGLIVPVVIWLVKKDDLPGLDPHGKVVINWIISAVIYGVASGILVLLLIGIPLLLVLWVLGLVFPIIGAIKANEGVVWEYPLSIRFLS